MIITNNLFKEIWTRCTVLWMIKFISRLIENFSHLVTQVDYDRVLLSWFLPLFHLYFHSIKLTTSYLKWSSSWFFISRMHKVIHSVCPFLFVNVLFQGSCSLDALNSLAHIPCHHSHIFVSFALSLIVFDIPHRPSYSLWVPRITLHYFTKP